MDNYLQIYLDGYGDILVSPEGKPVVFLEPIPLLFPGWREHKEMIIKFINHRRNCYYTGMDEENYDFIQSIKKEDFEGKGKAIEVNGCSLFKFKTFTY